MIKWWDPLTILGKFCNVKKWMGRPKEVTVKNMVGRREYILITYGKNSEDHRFNQVITSNVLKLSRFNQKNKNLVD